MNSDGNKWYLLLNKKSFQQNYLSIMFLIIVWIMYSLNKIIGLFVTLIAFFSILYLDYHWTVILKVAVIILTSAILFLTTTKMMKPKLFNNVMTNLIRLNIAMLIFSIGDILLKIQLFLITITTPRFIYSNNVINKKSNFIDSNLWFVLTSFVLYQYYSNNIHFYSSKNYSMVIFALFFPFINQIFDNEWLEPRALSLCLVTIIDAFRLL